MEYLILSASIVNFLLGLVVILRTRNKESIAFFIFALSSSLWTFSNYYLRIAEDILFLKISYSLGIIVATFGLIWTFYFLKKRLPLLLYLYVIPLSSVFFYLSLKTTYIIENLTSVERFGYNGQTGQYFFLYSIHLGIIVALIIITLLKELRTEQNIIRKNQILFVLFGAVIFATTSFSVSFLVPTFFNTFNLTILDNFGFSIFLFLIVYATIKHRLFNIKVIATELLVFLLWIFIIVKALIATTPNEKISEVILLLITVVIGIFLIRSVLKEVEAREEIERLAKDLSSANARLKELDKLKSEFVSIASHQLRSPLTAIKGYASLIKDGSFGKVSPGVGEAIDKIFQSSQALVAMVEDFLNISRIEQGRMKFEFESFDLKTLAVEIIDELKPTVERAGLTLSLSTDHQEPYAIKADRNKIRQIINNLIDNAIKYTPKGSISVTLSRRPNRNKILIAIADTGIGIDAETIPHLFEKFSRAKDANKVNVIGTGLGLYIVKEIVNGHHGRVWVESSGKGSGSTFFVELDEDSTVIHATRVADFAKTM